MASPGPDGPPEPKTDNRHYRNNSRSKASKVMMDQQNFEAMRPVSADPAVALAKALGQLPEAKPVAKPATPKTSVEDLAEELGLKLGDQNELTIRRIKRGKSYSFIRPHGQALRDKGTIK